MTSGLRPWRISSEKLRSSLRRTFQVRLRSGARFSSQTALKDETLGGSVGENRSRLAAGFTIVEVMIVLAMAGLILAIVFEAIPALERSSRNNQRRQDVAAILQAVSHYELNNSGDFPGATSNFLQFSHLSYYTTAQVHLFASPPTNPSPVTNVNTVNVYNYELCSPSTAGATTNQGADYSNTVALYAFENGPTASASACQQL